MDLERTLQRLARAHNDPRGYTELPRGAWLEYRALLAPRLKEEELSEVEKAYNEIIEWNEIIWSAFSRHPPQYFHGAEQHPLEVQAAAALLEEKYERLRHKVIRASDVLGRAREREGKRDESEVSLHSHPRAASSR